MEILPRRGQPPSFLIFLRLFSRALEQSIKLKLSSSLPFRSVYNSISRWLRHGKTLTTWRGVAVWEYDSSFLSIIMNLMRAALSAQPRSRRFSSFSRFLGGKLLEKKLRRGSIHRLRGCESEVEWKSLRNHFAKSSLLNASVRLFLKSGITRRLAREILRSLTTAEE